METPKFNMAAKVGLFVLLAIAIITYLTVRVSDFSISPAGTYSVYLNMKSAEGIDHKTPVQIAGIQIGVVDQIELTDQSQAKLRLKIKNGVLISSDAQAEIRTKGVLGDTFLEIIPGKSGEMLRAGENIQHATPYANFGELTRNLNDVALNLKDISASIKTYVSTENSSLSKIMTNMEKLTDQLAGFAGKNRQSMDMIVQNLHVLTRDLRGMVQESSSDVTAALNRIDNITRKIDEGKGSLGKLINDPQTTDKVNEALDGVNDLVGSVNRLQLEVGYHLEYLAKSKDMKNYVSLAVKPRPDKYFLLELVTDPDPTPTRTRTLTDITTNGVTNTVFTDKEETKSSTLRFSAQFAKKFHDFTFRGGLIESTGGVGIDYNKGPFGLQFSAFDFAKSDRDRAHLKAMGTVNLTKSVYVLGGVDDFISKRHGPDWFFGAGLRFVDEDIKSLLGAFSFKR
ncbi:MAG: MCE family protein [Deltaproteobacteria bacterium]|nr:MCE family protein [Deltaproteobacteria bacterium]